MEHTTTKRLYRSQHNKVLFGVCGGVGDYLGLDPVLIRIIWILAIFFGGAGLVAYLVAAILVPKEEVVSPAQPQAAKTPDSRMELLIGSVLLVLGLVLFFQQFDWFCGIPNIVQWPWKLLHSGMMWALLLSGVGFLLIYASRKQGAVIAGSAPGKRFMRSRSNRRIWGICGGLAEYFNIDPTIVRVVVVLLTLATHIFPVLLLYILMMVIVPVDEGSGVQSPPQSDQPPSNV